MKVRVRWRTTETHEAVVDVPSYEVDDLWGGDSSVLVELEEGADSWQGTERQTESVEVLS